MELSVTLRTADSGQHVADAVLTDRHSASSYGLPVVVLDDGRVLGAGEMQTRSGVPMSICVQGQTLADARRMASPAQGRLIQSALDAGYHFIEE